MIDGEKILEWLDYFNGCTLGSKYDGYTFHQGTGLLTKQIIKKIQYLMSETNDDKVSTVEPSAWQVGDKIILQDEKQSYVSYVTRIHDNVYYAATDLGYEFRINRLTKNTDFDYRLEVYKNIDAERRALQADTGRLKGRQKVEQSVDVDPWCYDLEKAPKDGLVLFKMRGEGYSEHPYFIMDFLAPFNIWCEYDDGNSECEYVDKQEDIEAWMPIPEPKGA